MIVGVVVAVDVGGSGVLVGGSSVFVAVGVTGVGLEVFVGGIGVNVLVALGLSCASKVISAIADFIASITIAPYVAVMSAGEGPC